MRIFLALSVAVVTASLAPTAFASQVVSTSNVSDLSLAVNAKGEALVTYRTGSETVHLLAWGAINAIKPTTRRAQLAFKLDYAGGYGKYFKGSRSAQFLARQFRSIQGSPGYLVDPVTKQLRELQLAASTYWKTGFNGGCAPYDGPALAWVVAACKAPDGSYWAVQRWQRKLPNYGLVPNATQSANEVHLAHWRGAVPVLTISTDWSWRKWDHLFGSFTYKGSPVFGFHVTPTGQPLDSFGRNLYVDTLDSAYGSGWKRENSFLTHNPTGVFCYSVNPHGSCPAGTGTQYRATIIGPGVTPDVMWQGMTPGTFDPAADATKNTVIASLGDKLCRPN